MRGVTPTVAVLEELGADLHYTRGPALEHAQPRMRGQISISDVGQNCTGGFGGVEVAFHERHRDSRAASRYRGSCRNALGAPGRFQIRNGIGTRRCKGSTICLITVSEHSVISRLSATIDDLRQRVDRLESSPAGNGLMPARYRPRSDYLNDSSVPVCGSRTSNRCCAFDGRLSRERRPWRCERRCGSAQDGGSPAS